MAGYRGLLAPWIGGAGANPIPALGGYRSLLAFWAGGAGGVTPSAEPIVLAYTSAPVRIPVDRLRGQQMDEDELIVLIIANALPLLH